MQKVTPFLWFDDKAEEAAEFYVDVFNESAGQLQGVEGPGRLALRRGRTGHARHGDDRVVPARGTRVHGAERRPASSRSPRRPRSTCSCESQDEVDHFWKALTDGGEESQCGWLKDRYGLSWQIIPTALHELLGDPDPARAGRAMQAMLQMQKIDIAELQRAADAA